MHKFLLERLMDETGRALAVRVNERTGASLEITAQSTAQSRPKQPKSTNGRQTIQA
jgi:hypothetical protein